MTGIQKTIRVLSVTGTTNRGGTETWILHLLRHINQDNQHLGMDFLVNTPLPGHYDEEIRQLGGKVLYCPYPSPWIFALNFKRILREHGPYDVVHSHVHYFNGFVLRLAAQAKVPIRIAHSHFNRRLIEVKAGLYRRIYSSLMRRWIAAYATLGLACSHAAAMDLFGNNWKSDSRWKVFYCSVDLSPFKERVNSLEVRSELGIPEDALVVGHVGRFSEQKNHSFLVKIAATIFMREPKMYLLLVGDGPLRKTVEKQVAKLGLTNQVRFAGVRNDVHRLMMGAMDIFLLPSLYEGLPLVLIEAQAAGLPCLISDCITEEAGIIDSLVKLLPLSLPVSGWADSAVAAFKVKPSITQRECLSFLEQGPFNIVNSANKLLTYFADHKSK